MGICGFWGSFVNAGTGAGRRGRKGYAEDAKGIPKLFLRLNFVTSNEFVGWVELTENQLLL